MKYKELVEKYQNEVEIEYNKFKSLGSKELNDLELDSIKFRDIIFEYRSGLLTSSPKDVKGLKTFADNIEKQVKEYERPYFNLKVGVNYSSIVVSVNLLRQHIDRFLNEKHKYEFQKDFTKVIKMEAGLKYLNTIDCSIIKMYRDGLITLDTVIKSIKSC